MLQHDPKYVLGVAQYKSLHYIHKCFPLFSKFPLCCLWNLLLPLTHPTCFTVSDVSITYDGDGYLKCITHASINIAHVWSICLTYVPGGMVVWVLCKHKGNYTQVKIEVVLFNDGRYWMIVIPFSGNRALAHLWVLHGSMTVFGRWPCYSPFERLYPF